MKLLLLSATFILTQACDQPQRTRFTTDTSSTVSNVTCASGYVTAQDGNVVCSDNISGGTTTDTSTGTVTDGSTDVTSEAGFENCNLNFQYYKSSIGSWGLCQSSQNESSFKLKMQLTDANIGTCFVPVNIQSNGNSFSLGIAECVHNQANVVYPMTLSKTRAEAINGVMVIKANALNAYNTCMSAKNTYMNQYANCASYSSCVDAANNYATEVCTNFVSNYAVYYKQISL